MTVEQPDWAVVQEIHAIHKQGGKLDESCITVAGNGEITIRRQYKMPDGTIRVMKNQYPNTDDLDDGPDWPPNIKCKNCGHWD